MAICIERLLGAWEGAGTSGVDEEVSSKEDPWPNKRVVSGVRTSTPMNMLDGFLFSQDLVVLKSSLSSPGEKPCFLYLRCDPNGGEEIVSVGILSSARNMEVYLGEEYCGTSRGKTVCGDPENRFVTCERGGVLAKPWDFASFCGIC